MTNVALAWFTLWQPIKMSREFEFAGRVAFAVVLKLCTHLMLLLHGPAISCTCDDQVSNLAFCVGQPATCSWRRTTCLARWTRRYDIPRVYWPSEHSWVRCGTVTVHSRPVYSSDAMENARGSSRVCAGKRAVLAGSAAVSDDVWRCVYLKLSNAACEECTVQ